MTMLEVVRSIVGMPPVLFEYLEYMFACVLMLFMFAVLWNVIIGFSKMYGAK